MKLPVFKAFSAGLAYFTTHFLDVIRLAWLPALLLTAAMFYLIPLYMEPMTAIIAIDSTASEEEMMAAMAIMVEGYKWMGLFYVAAAILYPMLIAGGLKHIIRGQGRLPFYLQFGGDEFRVLIAYVLFTIMVSIASVAGMLGLMVLGATAAAISQEIGAIVFAVAALAVAIAFVWFLLRLSVIFPATIATKEIAFGEAWRLTKGNAWRLFFYFFFWMLIMMVVGAVFGLLMMSGFLGSMGELFAAGVSDTMSEEELARLFMERLASMWDVTKPGGILLLVGAYFYTIFNIAFWNISTGIAYRYLSQEEEAGQ